MTACTMTAPTIVVPVAPFEGVHVVGGTYYNYIPSYLTLNKEYAVIQFDPPSLAWIVDDEGDEIAIIVPDMHPANFAGGHYAYWKAKP